MNNTYNNDVEIFKNVFCDENKLICRALINEFIDFFHAPVLDIGAGMGDILADVLPDKKVISLDSLEYTQPLPSSHQRLQGDFYTFAPKEKIGTCFICHSQQFLDDEPAAFIDALKRIAPKNIIVVSNKNDDILGDIVSWSKEHYPTCNPEETIEHLLPEFSCEKEITIKATVQAKDFESLALQISYLMLIPQNEVNIAHVKALVENLLEEPRLTFSQSIKHFSPQ